MASQWNEMQRKGGGIRDRGLPHDTVITSGDYNNGAYWLDTIHNTHLNSESYFQETIDVVNSYYQRIYDKYHIDEWETEKPLDYNENAVDTGKGWIIKNEVEDFWKGYDLNVNEYPTPNSNLWGSPYIKTPSPNSFFKKNKTYFLKVYNENVINYYSYIYVNDYRIYSWSDNNKDKYLVFTNDKLPFSVISQKYENVNNFVNFFHSFSRENKTQYLKENNIYGICLVGVSLNKTTNQGSFFLLPASCTQITSAGIQDQGEEKLASDVLITSRVNDTDNKYKLGKIFILSTWS